MTEEEISDELTRLGTEWALEEEPEGVTAEVTAIVEVDPDEWVMEAVGVPPDRAFVVNILLDSTEVDEEREGEGEREVSAIFGYFSDDDRLAFAYGTDYPLIEPDDEEDEAFDDEEFDEAEEQWS